MYEDNAKVAVPGMAGQLSANQANRNLGGIQGNPKDAPASIIHTQRLFACLQELAQLNTRLACTADRITGPVPQAETSPDRPPPDSLTDRLEFGIVGLGGLLGRMRQEIERIERFV